jgi:adenine-specific DNA-methyltransferase
VDSQLICGNCIEVLRTLPAQSVDFVLTDPPYIARYKDRTERSVPNDDNAAWLRPAFREIYRLMKPDTFCISFYGWPKVDLFMNAWKASGLRPRAHFVFPKRYASGKSVVEYRHEQAFLLAKGEPKPNSIIGDVLDWRYTGNNFHPTQKPLIVLRPLIEAFSKPGQLILDPFAGSGSTAVAATQLGRRYLAIELNEEYCTIARDRIARAA